MKKVWNSIFQTVSESVKTLSECANKKARHDVVLMTTGISVVTLLTFTAGDLSGNGQNAMVAFAETHTQATAEEIVLEETVLEETDLDELMIGEEHIETATTIDKLFVGATEESVLEAETEAAETEETVENDEYAEAELSEEMAAEEKTELVTTEKETEAAAAKEETEEAEETFEKIVLSQDEYNVLLRIVQAEAGTCDEDGKLLVANVILNRTECEEFPDTVRGVVYQKYQFSPVMNGTIDTCRVTDETRNAVSRALSGEDISEGALYFMNRSKSASRNVRWFDTNLEYLFKHGEHEFFK